MHDTTVLLAAVQTQVELIFKHHDWHSKYPTATAALEALSLTSDT